MKRVNALTIAGTDPSGGAGIQADLKTFSALGVYGCSVITALVAQNTNGVQSIYYIKPEFIEKQLQSVFTDVRIDSTKIGMLSNIDVINVVSEQLKKFKVKNIVLDTVIFSKSGDLLLPLKAVKEMQKNIFPLVDIITPNIPEAAILLDVSCAKNEQEIIEQGKNLISLGCKAVLIKGGHLNISDSPDWFFTKNENYRFIAPYIHTKNTHGTGCTLSAALTALRLHNKNWNDTIREAKLWLSNALKYADTLEVGRGIGPVHHFYAWW